MNRQRDQRVKQVQAQQVPCNAFLEGYERIDGGTPVPVQCTKPAHEPREWHADQRNGSPIEWQDGSVINFEGREGQPKPFREKRQTIDLTPRGCQTPEGNARVNKAMQAFEESAAPLANAAIQFIDDWGALIRSLVSAGGTTEDKQGLTEDLHQLEALIGARQRAQEEFMRSVAGVPPLPGLEPDAIHELTEIVHADADPEDEYWALYIFAPDGFHSGKQWFTKTIRYPDEQITVAEAKARADKAIAEGHEVRVCDGGDFLVFHSENGVTVHGDGFWELAAKEN